LRSDSTLGFESNKITSLLLSAAKLAEKPNVFESGK
jgi:hypothetical protein